MPLRGPAASCAASKQLVCSACRRDANQEKEGEKMPLKKYEIRIYRGETIIASVPLGHEYENEEQAACEAEDIADQLCRGDDEDWTLVEADAGPHDIGGSSDDHVESGRDESHGRFI
jgi:hypothetical protein